MSMCKFCLNEVSLVPCSKVVPSLVYNSTEKTFSIPNKTIIGSKALNSTNTQLLIEVSEHVCGADTRGFFYIETLTAFVFCRNFCASDLSTFRRKWCISELSSSGISVETPIFRIFRKIISTAPATTHAASQWMNELNWPKREDTKYKTYGIRKWTMNDQEWIELSSVFWKKPSILEKCTFIMKFNWHKLL